MVLQAKSNEDVTSENPEVFRVPDEEKTTTEEQPQKTKIPASVDRSQMSNEWKREHPE